MARHRRLMFFLPVSATKRPGYGIPPSDWDTLPGRVAKVNIREDDVVVWEMIE